MNDDFLKKLMVSKAIMDKTDNIKGSPKNSQPQHMVEDFLESCKTWDFLYSITNPKKTIKK